MRQVICIPWNNANVVVLITLYRLIIDLTPEEQKKQNVQNWSYAVVPSYFLSPPLEIEIY